MQYLLTQEEYQNIVDKWDDRQLALLAFVKALEEESDAEVKCRIDFRTLAIRQTHKLSKDKSRLVLKEPEEGG